MRPVTRSRPARTRSAPARSLDRALFVVGAMALLAGVSQILLGYRAAGLALIIAVTAVFWLFVSVGIVAWRRRPSNPMGCLIVVAGVMLLLATISMTDVPGLVLIGMVAATLALPATLHLLLAFPSGKLRGWRDRLLVVAAYALSTVGQAPLYLFSVDSPFPLMVLSVDAVALARGIQASIGAVVTGCTAWVLASRWARSDRTQRRVLAPLFAYGLVTVLALQLSGYFPQRMFGVDPLTGFLIQLAVIAGVPIAFGLGMLRGGFARTGELEELGVLLGSTGAARIPLTDTLAQTLGDPTLRLVFWSQEMDTYVTGSGTIAAPAATGRGWCDISLDGRVIGGIDYDAEMIRDRDHVVTAARVVAIAVDRERLVTELRVRTQEVRRSRERLIEVAGTERRRIARDLHDGMQTRLVLLALHAQRLGGADPEDIEERATNLRREVDDAAAELRRVVHDLVPAALIERGLVSALEELADRMPLPTRVEGLLGEVPEPIADAAYFVVSEALTNVIKHANARSVLVELSTRTHPDGERLVIEVRDDGRGGARARHGGGLQGLTDRVAAVGGTMTVISRQDEGTRLCINLPCAS